MLRLCPCLRGVLAKAFNKVTCATACLQTAPSETAQNTAGDQAVPHKIPFYFILLEALIRKSTMHLKLVLYALVSVAGWAFVSCAVQAQNQDAMLQVITPDQRDNFEKMQGAKIDLD